MALNKTIEIRPRRKSVYPKLQESKAPLQPEKHLRFLDRKHNMQEYLRKILLKQGKG